MSSGPQFSPEEDSQGVGHEQGQADVEREALGGARAAQVEVLRHVGNHSSDDNANLSEIQFVKCTKKEANLGLTCAPRLTRPTTKAFNSFSDQPWINVCGLLSSPTLRSPPGVTNMSPSTDMTTAVALKGNDVVVVVLAAVMNKGLASVLSLSLLLSSPGGSSRRPSPQSMITRLSRRKRPRSPPRARWWRGRGRRKC